MSESAREEVEDVIRDYAFDFDLPEYRRGIRWHDVTAALDAYERAIREGEDA